MVYGYDTNKEFVDKSYQLLDKMEAKGLWNKDTLVIGLDKSVRPLAYTLRKLSLEEKRETPDIRFFNYSTNHFRKEELTDKEIGKISKEIQKKINPFNFKKYNRVVLLDDHIYSGKSLKESKRIFKDYFSKSKNNPEINLAALGTDMGNSETLNKEDFIFVDEYVLKADEYATGINDRKFEKRWYELFKKKPLFETSVPIKYHTKRERFVNNRQQLSRDIKQYLHEKHPEKVFEKKRGLEKIISGIFIFSFVLGLFLSRGDLTGNVVGNSETAHKVLGIVLVLIGIGGFFVYRNLKGKVFNK